MARFALLACVLNRQLPHALPYSTAWLQVALSPSAVFNVMQILGVYPVVASGGAYPLDPTELLATT